MNSDHIDVLMREYQVQQESIGKLTSPLYNLAPLAVTAGGFLLIIAHVDKGTAGISACFGLLVISLWIAHVHCWVCANGLRLVEIELKVSQLLNVEVEEFDWCIRMTGAGISVSAGAPLNFAITFVVGVIALLASLYYGIGGLLQQQVSIWLCSVSALAFLVLLAALWFNVVRTEVKTRKAKAKLVQQRRANGK